MNKKMKQFENQEIKKGIEPFNIGDTVQVYAKIKEEGKVRIQMIEGVVIKKQVSGAGRAFTVRRISYGEGVERTFPLNSPNLDRVKVVRKGKVKRAKLYYLRKKIGKKTKVQEQDAFGGASPGAAGEADAPREGGSR